MMSACLWSGSTSHSAWVNLTTLLRRRASEPSLMTSPLVVLGEGPLGAPDTFEPPTQAAAGLTHSVLISNRLSRTSFNHLTFSFVPTDAK